MIGLVLAGITAAVVTSGCSSSVAGSSIAGSLPAAGQMGVPMIAGPGGSSAPTGNGTGGSGTGSTGAGSSGTGAGGIGGGGVGGGTLPSGGPNQPSIVGSGNSGAPGWITAGTRITWYVAGASVAQSRYSWVEDPNGGWQDPRTGKHYRRTDESGEGQPTSSGDGVSQLDVVAVEGTAVVLTNTVYGIDRGTNTLVAAGTTGARVEGESVDGSWINPQKLAQLQSQDLGGILVLVGDYVLGGKTYKAVSFVNPAPNAYSSYTYDTQSGLLLAATTSTAGATSPIAAQGQAAPQGNTQLTITRLAGVRQRSMPGQSGSNPNWVAQTPTMTYTGTYQLVNPLDPSTGGLNSPVTDQVSIKVGGPNWATYSTQRSIPVLGAPTQFTGVTGPAGIYWIDPAALSGLSPGSVLDTDPLTTEKVVVQATDGGTVTIATTLPGQNSVTTYDKSSGRLLSYQLQQPAGGVTLQLRLQG